MTFSCGWVGVTLFNTSAVSALDIWKKYTGHWPDASPPITLSLVLRQPLIPTEGLIVTRYCSFSLTPSPPVFLVLLWCQQLLLYLLYSIGNSTQYSVITCGGKESEKELIHVYVWLIHFAVHLKLSQHCKSTTFQRRIKIKFKKVSFPNLNKKQHVQWKKNNTFHLSLKFYNGSHCLQTSNPRSHWWPPLVGQLHVPWLPLLPQDCLSPLWSQHPSLLPAFQSQLLVFSLHLCLG